METKNNKKRKIEIAVPVVAILLFLVLILALHYCENTQPGTTQHDVALQTDTVSAGDLPQLSEDEITELLRKKQKDSFFTVQASSQGTIQPGSRTLALSVANPRNNKYDCRFQIILSETQKSIYTSPILRPRSYLENEYLTEALEAGEHKAIIRYSILDKDGGVCGLTDVEVLITCINGRKQK